MQHTTKQICIFAACRTAKIVRHESTTRTLDYNQKSYLECRTPQLHYV